MSLRVLVADDNQAMRAAYQYILGTKDDIEVVGVASDGQEVLDKCIELAPDVAILDLRMPYIDGLAAANLMMTNSPGTAIVIVSAYDEMAFVRAIMHEGASGKAYLLKNSLADIPEFIRVVEAVAKGQAVVHETIIQKLIVIYRRLTASQTNPLTDTEESVLKLMLSGYDETDIAMKLGLPFEAVDVFAVSLCVLLRVSVRDGSSRSPRVVQALVNLCVPGTSSSSSILGGSSSVMTSPLVCGRLL